MISVACPPSIVISVGHYMRNRQTLQLNISIEKALIWCQFETDIGRILHFIFTLNTRWHPKMSLLRKWSLQRWLITNKRGPSTSYKTSGNKEQAYFSGNRIKVEDKEDIFKALTFLRCFLSIMSLYRSFNRRIVSSTNDPPFSLLFFSAIAVSIRQWRAVWRMRGSNQ